MMNPGEKYRQYIRKSGQVGFLVRATGLSGHAVMTVTEKQGSLLRRLISGSLYHQPCKKMSTAATDVELSGGAAAPSSVEADVEHMPVADTGGMAGDGDPILEPTPSSPCAVSPHLSDSMQRVASGEAAAAAPSVHTPALQIRQREGAGPPAVPARTTSMPTQQLQYMLRECEGDLVLVCSDGELCVSSQVLCLASRAVLAPVIRAGCHEQGQGGCCVEPLVVGSSGAASQQVAQHGGSTDARGSHAHASSAGGGGIHAGPSRNPEAGTRKRARPLELQVPDTCVYQWELVLGQLYPVHPRPVLHLEDAVEVLPLLHKYGFTELLDPVVAQVAASPLLQYWEYLLPWLRVGEQLGLQPLVTQCLGRASRKKMRSLQQVLASEHVRTEVEGLSHDMLIRIMRAVRA